MRTSESDNVELHFSMNGDKIASSEIIVEVGTFQTERETEREKGEKRAKHLLGGGWSSKRGRLFSKGGRESCGLSVVIRKISLHGRQAHLTEAHSNRKGRALGNNN